MQFEYIGVRSIYEFRSKMFVSNAFFENVFSPRGPRNLKAIEGEQALTLSLPVAIPA